jgi:hypothetical protein
MPGMRSEADILKAFEGLDTRPGSRHARVSENETAKRKRAKVFNESNGWDENPILKALGGKEVEFFTIGAFAQALEKQVVTMRYWEKKGYIPAAPYRLKSKTLNGKKVSGNRVYTRELIESVQEEFEKRGLLGTARVEWNQQQSLTDVIVRRWKEITESSNASQP